MRLPRVVKFIQTKSKTVITRTEGKKRIGDSLVDTGFVGDEKKVAAME